MVKSGKGNKANKVLFAFALLSLLVACSGKKDVKPDDMSSAAAPIPLEEKASPGADDAIFADLTKDVAPADTTNLSAAPADAPQANVEMEKTEANKAAEAGDSPFYNTIGGESLGRVAYTLYGSRKYTTRLLNQNPDLKGTKALSANEKVYFDFNSLSPQPMYLTKGLIDSYTVELAQHIEQEPATQEKETVSLAPGQTLQSLSQQLYGTTRYWTEIYLLNHDKLSGGYDKVAAGTELTVVKRTQVAMAPAAAKVVKEPESATPDPIQEENAAMSPAAPAPPAPTASAVIASPPPPPLAVAVPTPAPKVEEPAVVNNPLPQMNTHPAETPATAKAPTISSDSLFSSTNMRRVIYVTLILGIALAAFYVTRPVKRAGFDMLDVTTQNGSGPPKRPRLADRDDNNQNVG